MYIYIYMYIFIYGGGVAPWPSAIHRERSARCTTSAAVAQNLCGAIDYV